MLARLIRDVQTPWGVFARGLEVAVDGPDGADAVVVALGPSMVASVPVVGLVAVGGDR